MATAAKKSATPKTKAVKGVKVNLFILGSDGKTIGVKEGTTLQQFREMNGLEGVNVALNDNKKPTGATVLKEGDRIAVVPEAKGGRQ